MRMQLRLIILTMCLPVIVYSQHKVLDETEVNFLFHYYEQDGNHSPVTGGIGTEELNCFAPVMMVNVPFDTVNNIGVNIGADYYTSASSDRIDRFITSASSQYLSSASSRDLRGHADISYSRSNKTKTRSWGIMTGYSKEFDVSSIASGLNFSRATKNLNTEFGFKGSLYYDTWLLIYPGEYRNGDEFRYGNNPEDYDSDTRLTYNFSFSWMQVLNKRLHFLFVTDYVAQRGILHTPFHRVYFNDGFDVPDSLLFMKTMFPENLPRQRNKLPMSIRVNYYLNDYFIVRTFFRHYIDDFGMTANTASIEIPVKVLTWLTLYPMFRYHEQTASKYFAPFAEHELDMTTWTPLNEFYTSDWDQAAISNIKYGIGLKFYPYKGIFKLKIRDNRITMKSVEFRYSNYNRSDGLKAQTFGIDLGFKL